MEWKQIPLGVLQTNCYILYNHHKECIIVDPGAEGDKLISFLHNEELLPLSILLTHAHFDHIGAVDDVRNHYKIPVYIHDLEANWLGDASLNGSQLFMNGRSIQTSPADVLLTEEGDLSIGAFTFKIFETPGHSPGSVSFYVKDIDTVFAGDTLFLGSIGRTDLPGGNHHQLLISIQDKLLTLPEGTAVLPGHGPITSVQKEKESNPFLTGI
jgi:hydroxyacylglutathione hydrolase